MDLLDPEEKELKNIGQGISMNFIYTNNWKQFATVIDAASTGFAFRLA